MKAFISGNQLSDPRVVEFLEALKHRGVDVDHSPDPDPSRDAGRWKDWYDSGCVRAVECCDRFVAVVTEGYDCSTWMCIEFEAAYKLFKKSGRPRMFIYRAVQRPLPLGFRPYEKLAAELPVLAEEAAEVLVS